MMKKDYGQNYAQSDVVRIDRTSRCLSYEIYEMDWCSKKLIVNMSSAQNTWDRSNHMIPRGMG